MTRRPPRPAAAATSSRLGTADELLTARELPDLAQPKARLAVTPSRVDRERALEFAVGCCAARPDTDVVAHARRIARFLAGDLEA